MKNIKLFIYSSYGGMAELVDALDSKSCGLRPCQFESDYPYQQKRLCLTKPFLVLCDIKYHTPFGNL